MLENIWCQMLKCQIQFVIFYQELECYTFIFLVYAENWLCRRKCQEQKLQETYGPLHSLTSP